MNELPAPMVASESESASTTAAPTTSRAGERTVRICAPGEWPRVEWLELWSFRELLYFLVWRDLKVRYKQTVLGILWAVLQPVVTTVIFVVFFGRLGGMSRFVDTAYPVFVYSALLPWIFFATAVANASNSMLVSSHIVSKIYFPRLLIPLAAVAGGVLDFAIAFILLVGLLVQYGVSPTANLLFVPVFVAGTVVTAAGVGILLAALVVAYRDFRYVTGFLLQVWMFASPIVYPLEVVPEAWRLVYSLNPMVGMISGFRSAVLGVALPLDAVLVSSTVAVASLVLGVQYFLHAQRRFADII